MATNAAAATAVAKVTDGLANASAIIGTCSASSTSYVQAKAGAAISIINTAASVSNSIINALNPFASDPIWPQTFTPQ